MKRKLTRPIACMVYALALAPLLGAPIQWTVHDITNDVNGSGFSSDVSASGTVVVDGARNGATSDRTVNTVVFESVANSGNLFDSLFRNDNIAARGPGNVVSADSDYVEFLKAGQRSGRSQPNNWTTINFTNLVVGHSYQIQIWASDNAATALDTGLVLGDGAGGAPDVANDAIVLYEMHEGGAGQYATGYFVADAITQDVNVQKYNTLLTTPTAQTSDHFSNGWQIRDQGVDSTAPSPAPTVVTLIPFETSVLVEASTDTTDQTGVEYQFVRRLGLAGSVEFTSDWQNETSFLDTGLTASTEYSYTVNARDKTPTQYATGESAEVTVTTLAPDATPPTPATMTFDVVPTATSYDTITMTAVTATDTQTEVEYYFDETTGNPGGDDSGWQDSPTYVDTGLESNTEYTYTVQARDKAASPNANTVSSAESATTDAIGTATILWGAPTAIADDINDISTNGSLLEARSGGNSDVTVNGVTFLSRSNSGELFSSLFRIDSLGGSTFGNVVTDTAYRSLLGTGQRSGRIGFTDAIATPADEVWTEIEFFGLTPGNTYEIQFWASDNRNTAQDRATVLGNGDGDSPDPALSTDAIVWHEAGEGGAGQYVIGTFVANAPNQAFNARNYHNLLATASAQNTDHWSNAWQIRDITGVGGDDFATWSGGSAANGDDNGDGVANAVAYALGAADPAADARGLLPTFVYDDTGDSAYLVFTFNRDDEAEADGTTTIEVEYGSDLSGWTTAAHDPGGTGVLIAETGSAPTNVEVKIPVSLAVDNKIFARLNVTVSL